MKKLLALTLAVLMLAGKAACTQAPPAHTARGPLAREDPAPPPGRRG